MGKHAAPRAERRTGALPHTSLLLNALGISGTLVAWGLLVYAAIEFGRQARGGEPLAWVFLAVATLGATACLFVTLILGMRVTDLLRHR